MLDGIIGFVTDNLVGNLLGLIPPQLQGVAIILSVIAAVFFGKKQIFIKVIMRFFPNMFVNFMRNSGVSFNKFVEDKKAKGKFKDNWKVAEQKVIEGIAAFNSELKK
tara:strand:+ start:1627 stop:1947 length:321 start_codon:yes stop_codon:yes gene_type:complete